MNILRITSAFFFLLINSVLGSSLDTKSGSNLSQVSPEISYISKCGENRVLCSLTGRESDLNEPSTIVRLGDREGNGGNPAISNFKWLGSIVSRQLIDLYRTNRRAFDELNLSLSFLKALETANDTVKISCSESRILLRGDHVLAVNYPMRTPQQIILDCESFSLNLPFKQHSFVLHELLFLAGHDDSNYSMSTSLMRLLNSKKRKDLISTLQTNVAALSCDIESYREHVIFADTTGVLFSEGTTVAASLISSCNPILEDLVDRGEGFGLNSSDKNDMLLAAYFLMNLFDFIHSQSPKNKKKLAERIFLIKKLIHKGLVGSQIFSFFNTCYFNLINAPERLIDYLKAYQCREIDLFFRLKVINPKEGPSSIETFFNQYFRK